ncbi:MAG: SDR family oxidoreductase [Phycisphaerae bacterium]
MHTSDTVAVTGAFGYSGSYIARRLLDAGIAVRTLTRSPDRESDLRGRVDVHPLAFDDPASLRRSLAGVSVLINTYWVRFNHARFTFAQAVRNTLALFEAAQAAGVRRIVHVSITEPTEDSPLEYFRSKAELERRLRESGMSHCILRPAVLFGGDDILVNNIAWVLRRAPVFGVFGDGRYRIQPIHVDDFAALAVENARGDENCTINAVGPQIFEYRELAAEIGRIIGCPRRIVSVSPALGYRLGQLMGWAVGDVMITRDEIAGLMGGLLAVDTPPTGTTRLTDWAASVANTLGRRYASELGRRANRSAAYARV